MEEKITIIEGPTPAFETVSDGWALGINESPYLSDVVVTRLRTFNGPALVERCHRAWRSQKPIYLEYRESDGLENQAPILAARAMDLDEGQMLVLWVRMEPQEAEIEIGADDDLDEDIDDDGAYPDL